MPLEELEADRVLDLLADSRLVTVTEGTAEVAHEALLREWPRLRDWLQEDAEGRRLHAHLMHAAREWKRDDRDRGELYRGARLASALEWRAAHEPELNTIEQQFLDASRVGRARAGARAPYQARARRRHRAARAHRRGRAARARPARARDGADADGRGAAARCPAVNADTLDFGLLLARQGVALDESLPRGQASSPRCAAALPRWASPGARATASCAWRRTPTGAPSPSATTAGGCSCSTSRAAARPA